MMTAETIDKLTTRQLLAVGVMLLELGYTIEPDAFMPMHSGSNLIGPTRFVSKDLIVTLQQTSEASYGTITIVGQTAEILRQWLERGVLSKKGEEARSGRGVTRSNRPMRPRTPRNTRVFL